MWDVFWICDQTSSDNTLMFWQGLHSITAFSASPCQSGLRVHKKVGREGGRTADSRGPKGYSRAYGLVLGSKVEAGGKGLLGMAEHWSLSAEQLSSLALLGFFLAFTFCCLLGFFKIFLTIFLKPSVPY